MHAVLKQHSWRPQAPRSPDRTTMRLSQHPQQPQHPPQPCRAPGPDTRSTRSRHTWRLSAETCCCAVFWPSSASPWAFLDAAKSFCSWSRSAASCMAVAGGAGSGQAEGSVVWQCGRWHPGAGAAGHICIYILLPGWLPAVCKAAEWRAGYESRDRARSCSMHSVQASLPDRHQLSPNTS